MLNLTTAVITFSHTYCVAICAFLVPANLLATLLTLVWVGFGHFKRLWWSTTIANLFAILMVLHVLTWFLVGVVRVPTYVLLVLGCVCLSVNLWALFRPTQQQNLLLQLVQLWRFLTSKQKLSKPTTT
jgi:hypothetical protein